MIDPENGNYQVTMGTAAEEYGCQIFGERTILETEQNLYWKSNHRDLIEVSGIISEDTNWNVDTVLVIGDILVEENATLSIEPGTEVIFTDYYILEIEGILIAQGTADERIIFTAQNSELFCEDNTLLGCWKGIFFNGESSNGITSRLEFCIIEYAKALEESSEEFNTSAGGAIRIYDRSNLIIANSILRNNLAQFGGAIFCYKMANPIIAGNLIYNNFALLNVAAIYVGYSYPQIINNTIVENSIYNQDPYIETCAIKSYISKPVFANNIIRNNDAEIIYIHQQIWEGKEFLTHSNNIEGGLLSNGNIDVDPIYENDQEFPFQLSANSLNIDAGRSDLAYQLDIDLLGNPRIIGNNIDIGCYEMQETFADNNQLVSENLLSSYPNPYVLSDVNRNSFVTISFFSKENTKSFEIEIFNTKGQCVSEIRIANINSGINEVIWNGKDKFGKLVGSGVYIYQLKLDEKCVANKKMIVVK